MGAERNAPCTCQSGKKYKKCCGKPEAPRRSLPKVNRWSGKVAMLQSRPAAELLAEERLLVPETKRSYIADALTRAGVPAARVQAFAQTGAFAVSDVVPYPDHIEQAWQTALRQCSKNN